MFFKVPKTIQKGVFFCQIPDFPDSEQILAQECQENTYRMVWHLTLSHCHPRWSWCENSLLGSRVFQWEDGTGNLSRTVHSGVHGRSRGQATQVAWSRRRSWRGEGEDWEDTLQQPSEAPECPGSVRVLNIFRLDFSKMIWIISLES